MRLKETWPPGWLLMTLLSVSFLAVLTIVPAVRAQTGPQPPAAATGSSVATEPRTDVAPAAPVTDTPSVAPATKPPSVTPATPLVSAVPRELANELARIAARFPVLQQNIEDRKEFEDELARFRDDIEALAQAAVKTVEPLSLRLTEVRSQIEKLGPLPGKDAPPEAPALTQERAALNAAAAEIDAAIKQAEVLQVRARQLTGRVQDLRYRAFTRDLLRRAPSPLRPHVWDESRREAQSALSEIGSIFAAWWARTSPRLPEFLLLIAAGAASFAALRFGLRRVLASWQSSLASASTSFFTRAAVAAIEASVRAVPPIAGLTVAYTLSEERGFVGLQMGWLAAAVIQAACIFVLISSMTVAILQPRQSRWRLFDLSDASVTRLSMLIQAAAAVFAFDGAARDIIRNLYLALPIGIASSALSTVAFAALVIAIVRTPFEPLQASETRPRSLYWPRWLKLPLLAIALFVLGAALTGYVALGRFVIGQLLLTGSALVLLLLLHLAIRAVVEGAQAEDRTVGRALGQRLGLDAARRSILSGAIAFVLNAILVLIGLPILMLSWGFSASDVSTWLKALIFGFEIGQFRISLARILIALGLFVGLLFLTRLVVRWLDTRVFPSAKLEAGVSHSIRTGVGYAGYGLAGIAAISYVGLDLSNLALVAGALSVGIGLGLQSVVNNFVSGLILLVERPIKVGDWVVLKDREGIVRNISVRSTEIETFDRASLIVPNAELVTNAVVNWTHRNAIGRIVIRVGVSYSADPEQVRTILLKVAEASPSVLRHPPPIAALDAFGDSALQFSLRVFLGDIMDSLEAQSQLRMAILREFKTAGIEIPFPQADVHLRDLDMVKQVLGQVLRARQQAQGAPIMDDDSKPVPSPRGEG